MTRKLTASLLALLVLLQAFVFVLPASAATLDADLLAAVREKIKAGFDAFETEIDASVEGLSSADFFAYGQAALNQLQTEYPEYDPAAIIRGAQMVVDDRDTYRMEIRYQSGAREQRALLEATVAEILSGIDPDWGEVEKLLYVHDWLALNYSYDLTYQNASPYVMITEGVGVCEAYARFMRILLTRLGFENDYAHTDDHIWNLVRLSDGEWYHIDVTWDDPIPDRVGQAEHGYFLVSDYIRSYDGEGKPYPFVTPTYCTSTRFDQAGWRQSFAPLAEIDGTWYMLIRKTRTLATYDFAADKITPLGLMLPYWTTRDNPGNVYSSGYAGLIERNGVLYYNTPTAICGYDPAAGEKLTYFMPNTEKGYLVGIAEIEGELVFGIRNDPYDFEYVCLDKMAMPDYTEVTLRRSSALTVRRTASGRGYCFGLNSGATLADLLAQVEGGRLRAETRKGVEITDPAAGLTTGDRLKLFSADGSELDSLFIVIEIDEE